MKLIEENKIEKLKLIDELLQNQMYRGVKSLKNYAAILEFEKTNPDLNNKINDLHDEFNFLNKLV